MALKFSGNELRDGSNHKILCKISGNTITDPSNKILCKISGNTITDPYNKVLCKISGNTITDPYNKVLIKVSDAARKIGSTSQGPSTAAMWFMFCR